MRTACLHMLGSDTLWFGSALVKRWSDDIDPSTIPDDVLASEHGRRNALKRTTYTGGVFWKKHNPDTSRCRCRACMKKRSK